MNQTYQNIIQSSVKPREEYYRELEKVKEHILKALAIIEGKNQTGLPEINLDMPFETI